jgi:hypothetical protein
VPGTIVTNYPTSVAEANAALKLGVFDHGWLCDDASGNLAPTFGGLTLVAGGTGAVYGYPGPAGVDDKAIGFGAPRTGQFSGGSAFDVTATDDLLVAWVGAWLSLPVSFGTMFGKVSASFANGWAVSGTDGTNLEFGLGSGSTIGVVLAGTSAFHVGSWHVGIAAIDRAAGRAGFGTRSLAGTVVTGSNGLVGATSLSNASNFFVGKNDWVSANDTFRLSALYVGKSVGAAAGVPANLAATLLSFHASVTRSDNYKAKLMRRRLPPPYNKDFGEVIPAILTVIGQSDNIIGGLFGTDDFLPDEG